MTGGRERLSGPLRAIPPGTPLPPHLRAAFDLSIAETAATGVDAIHEALRKAGLPVEQEPKS